MSKPVLLIKNCTFVMSENSVVKSDPEGTDQPEIRNCYFHKMPPMPWWKKVWLNATGLPCYQKILIHEDIHDINHIRSDEDDDD